jgi:hypothetical protein
LRDLRICKQKPGAVRAEYNPAAGPLYYRLI